MIERAVSNTRKARRQYQSDPSDYNWELLTQACKDQAREIQRAKTGSWRRVLAEASKDSRKIWALEKWARVQSHAKPAPLALPPLRRAVDSEPVAFSHTEKAQLLAERFFPSPEADLADITDRE